MSDHKKKIRKAVEKVQRRLLGDDDDMAKVMKKNSTPEESDASMPQGEDRCEAPGRTPPR
jgi:hypothetical protein